jgi:hypothetical protein
MVKVNQSQLAGNSVGSYLKRVVDSQLAKMGKPHHEASAKRKGRGSSK